MAHYCYYQQTKGLPGGCLPTAVAIATVAVASAVIVAIVATTTTAVLCCCHHWHALLHFCRPASTPAPTLTHLHPLLFTALAHLVLPLHFYSYSPTPAHSPSPTLIHCSCTPAPTPVLLLLLTHTCSPLTCTYCNYSCLSHLFVLVDTSGHCQLYLLLPESVFKH